MKISVIIAAAGKGTRAGYEKNKLLVEFNGQTALSKTVGVFKNNKSINEIIITCSKEDIEFVKTAFPFATVVLGGQTRTQSVKNALEVADSEIVLIHDGARPFLNDSIITRAIESAKTHGSGIVAIPNRDTLCNSDGEKIDGYLGKGGIYAIQTPQAFRTELIKKAYQLAGEKSYGDDSEIYKEFIGAPNIVLGSPENVKLTYPEDFKKLFNSEYSKTGVGFDCHKLVENRKLVLGGITVPHTKGLLGHSDADVLAHAIMDAILSAAAMRDIGYHFPDNDGKYKDANSMRLLDQVLKIIGEQGYKVSSVSACIMAEKPKLLNFIPIITENLANALNLSINEVGISATTLEGLGFVGREEGICVHATATIIKA